MTVDSPPHQPKSKDFAGIRVLRLLRYGRRAGRNRHGGVWKCLMVLRLCKCIWKLFGSALKCVNSSISISFCKLRFPFRQLRLKPQNRRHDQLTSAVPGLFVHELASSRTDPCPTKEPNLLELAYTALRQTEHQQTTLPSSCQGEEPLTHKSARFIH